jgi:predicted RND superfamily exporter protein
MIAVLDLGVALVGVVTVLPAMLVLEARRSDR